MKFKWIRGKLLRESIAKAEKALGHPLPSGAEVHHVDSNRENNKNTNLVVCENHAYHMLLHRRTRALQACGHATWVKCCYCKVWEEPSSMYINGARARHNACHAKASNEAYHARQ